MLVNMSKLLADAQKGDYAVGSFSVANMEMVLGVLKAAKELKAPVILQIAEVRLNGLDDNLVGTCNLLGLNVCIAGNLGDNRNNLCGDVIQAHILVEGDVGGSTTGEVHTVV